MIARLRRLRVEALAFGLVALAAIFAALTAAAGPAREAEAAVARAQLPAGRAAELVAATSASPTVVQATGDAAKLINASLPFSAAPIQASRPFDISGGDLDYRRALLCMTQAVYYEAGFEPIEGRRAVAQVVLNRMRHPAFPKSVCGVVYQGAGRPVCQFSFVCDGSLYRAPARAAWREAEQVAAAALAGHVEAGVGAATHYHADYVAPRWAPMLTKITKLGAHIFYRWPGAWGRQAAFTGRYAGEPADPLALRPPKPIDEPVGAAASAEIAAVEAGPPIARAENDVGGLLDVSKGWKLTIPAPEEVAGATARALAEQRAAQSPASPAAPSQAGAATSAAAPIIASR